MNVNLHAVAVWVGIAGSAAGIGFPAYTARLDTEKQITRQRQADVQRAIKEQADHDKLWQTLDKYQRNLDLLNENLPAQQRKIAQAVFARMQVERDIQPVYEKALPVLTERRMKLLPSSVAADTPAEEKPQ